jgi:phytoene dehydrogenase-like protein
VTAATVVGSGPNGLAAAITLARLGVDVTVLEAAGEVGGGTRSAELTVPGLLHDVCSAVHPLAMLSPFLRSLPLDRHGLRWAWPEVDLAHPLDGGRAGVMVRSLDDTASGLGVDGDQWRRLFGPTVAALDDLGDDLFRPVQHVPRHPVELLRFGRRAMLPATRLAGRWQRDETRALFGGVAAHAMYPLGRPATASVGIMLIAAGHRAGWPVAQGGSQAIAGALASVLTGLGGTVETGVRVRSLEDFPAGEAVLLDMAPDAVAGIAEHRLPKRVQWAYRSWRYGPGAFKVDLAVEGGVPWTNEACRRAGTVHVTGPLEELVETERQLHRGQMPERPFVIVAQQYLADPGRSAGGVHPVWAYAHVPSGYGGDATDAIIAQLDRFAPGVRDRIVGISCQGPADLERYNPNYVGGDIASGANDPWQLIMRPRPAIDPYSTGIPGVFVCSSATPPGAGVHGMCGVNAARSAARFLESGRRRERARRRRWAGWSASPKAHAVLAVLTPLRSDGPRAREAGSGR